MAVYVDDIILGARDEAKVTRVKEELSQPFEMKIWDLNTIFWE